MTTDDNRNRRAAVALLRLGFANLSEVARLAGVDRQLAYYWATSADVDVKAARNARLEKLWARQIVKQ